MDGSCNGGAGAVGGAADKPTANPPPSPPPAAAAGDDAASAAARAEGRRPFTSLSQEEADLALARVLQEQERAYMMLTGQGGGGYEMFDAEGYDYYDDDEDDDEHGEEDVSDYEEEEEGEALDEDEDDEEVGDAARHEGDDVAGRLMALEAFRDWQAMEQGDDDDGEDDEEDGEHQDAWEDVDPDEYSYEELVALGEVVGTESKGLSADTIASLPSVTYQAQDKQDGNMEQCVICRVEFDEGESLVALPCKHSYHSECIIHWLQLNKVCPMCSAEVSTSANKKA